MLLMYQSMIIRETLISNILTNMMDLLCLKSLQHLNIQMKTMFM